MPSAKKQALDILKTLPETATWDDIMCGIFVGKKIASGSKAADEGRVVSQDKVKLFSELTTHVRKAMTQRGISEDAILRDFQKSRTLRS